MLQLDDIDLMNIKDLYDDDLINQLNIENINKIITYLYSIDIDYAKDLFVEHLELFLIDYKEFIKRFEIIKKKLGNNYKEELLNNFLILDEMFV